MNEIIDPEEIREKKLGRLKNVLRLVGFLALISVFIMEHYRLSSILEFTVFDVSMVFFTLASFFEKKENPSVGPVRYYVYMAIYLVLAVLIWVLPTLSRR